MPQHKVLLRHPALAERINIGRIEKVDPEIKRRMHDTQRSIFVEPAAQIVAPEPHCRHSKPRSTEIARFHALLLSALLTNWLVCQRQLPILRTETMMGTFR
jgi:hypothetical protein